VVIPAYNAAGTIRRALDSVFLQNYQPIEVLVVDDASRDDTSDVVGMYRRPEIRLLSLSDNRGESSVNAGIEEAQGEYVAFLDADDEWRPTKLHKQIAVLGANSKATFVSCGCLFVDSDGKPYREFGRPPGNVAKNQIWRILLARSCIAKPCVVARTSLLREVGGFDPRLPVAGDQDMWIRLAMKGEVEFIDELLTIAHDTPNSLTRIYARKSASYVIPMIRHRVADRRSDISDPELRQILGERYTFAGRNLYASGSVLLGSAYIARAMALGDRPKENLWYLATASPPARVTKAFLSATRRKPVEIRATPAERSLLHPSPRDIVSLPPGPPILSVVVDAEAEFDWGGPYTRTLTSITNLRHQERAQHLFERFGVTPIYMVDFAVASQADGYVPLRDFLGSGNCEIGAHLQPWENPPFGEELTAKNSFLSNLPAWLQKEKLRHLTETIEKNFGVRPTAHKAGRYGVGPEFGWIGGSLGYEIDLSILPGVDLTRGFGPNFTHCFSRPYWFGPDKSLLEIPMSVSFVGALAPVGHFLGPFISHPALAAFHVPGVLARLHALERITLTPEGMTLQEQKRLAKALLARGQRTLTFSYHSPSLAPGHTRYVRTESDLEAFLSKIEGFFEFFFGTLRGIAMTPSEVRSLALMSRVSVTANKESVPRVQQLM